MVGFQRTGTKRSQLELPLSWPKGSPEHAVAWIVSMPADKIETANRWLASGDRLGRPPFFLDATRGSAIVNSSDVLILIDTVTNSSLVCLPRSLELRNPSQLLDDVFANGKPLGVFGATPQIHDLILVKGLGGGLTSGPRTNFRSMLDLTLDRLSSRPFRSDNDAVARICANAFNRWRLPEEMKELLQQMWANSIIKSFVEQGHENHSALREACSKEAQSLRLNNLHHGAAQLESIARKYDLEIGDHQLSFFEGEPCGLPSQIGSGLMHLRCSAIALSYQSSALPLSNFKANLIVRDDEIEQGRRVPNSNLGRWLREAVSLSLHPEVSIDRKEAGRGHTLVTVRMLPDFLRGVYDDFAENWTGRRGDGFYQIIPQLGERPFSPSDARVKLGEAITFSTKSVSRKQRRRVNLVLLTPNRRTVSVALPHMI